MLSPPFRVLRTTCEDVENDWLLHSPPSAPRQEKGSRAQNRAAQSPRVAIVYVTDPSKRRGVQHIESQPPGGQVGHLMLEFAPEGNDLARLEAAMRGKHGES